MFVRKIFLGCFVFFIAVLFGSPAYAVPAAPVVHTLSQPDGSTFEARQWGDEGHHGWETVEGYSIVFDEGLKSWTYAMSDPEGALVSSSKVAAKDIPPEVSKHLRPKGQARLRTPLKSHSKEITFQTAPQEVVPPTGTANIPVILMNFNDTTTTYTNVQFNTLLFGTGNNSMKDFYQQISYGAFSVSAGPAGIMGWYQASNTHDYYGSNVSGDDAWPGDLVYEAVVAADATVNFAPYDQDGDCYVDVVAIVHQGSGEEESGLSTDIWSHRWSLNAASYWGRSHNGAYTTNDPCTANPSQFVRVNDYTIQPEKDSSGPMQTIGVFAHEYGHALGLPDLYDTDYSSEGVGNWSLMAGGSWCYVSLPGDRPAHMDAWSKYKLGWVTPTQVTGTLTNEPIQQAATASDVYKLLTGSPNPPSGEYFLVENRQKAGFDVGLPGAGLLIWHIDESKTTNTEECPGGPPCANHYKVALVQADNLWNLEYGNSGDSGDPYPGSTSNTSFAASTSPNSNLYSGTASGVSLTGISASGPTMTATMTVSTAITQPNLTPYKPTSWSDKIVVSNTTGTNTDSTPIYPTDPLYVDWAVANNGTAATSATFYTTLYVDGAARQTWYTDPPLNINYYTYVQDYSIGTLSAGSHAIKIVTDTTGTISESSETDNEYTKTIIVSGGEFTDVPPTHWAYNYIMAIYNAHITTGCSQNPLKYCPEDIVPREQMAAFIVRAKEGEPAANYCNSGTPFPDVTPDMWSCKYIKRLRELGITTGYQDGTYGPYDLVPREQMAAFIVRAVQGEPAANYCDSGTPFPDVTSDMWSCKYIKALKALGITTGYQDGTYGPYDLVSRAQMAAFLSRAFLGMP